MSAERFDDVEAAPAGQAGPDQTRVTYLVKRLESAVRRDLDAIMHEQGLTTPQYAALSILRRNPGLSSAQLARRSFVTAQSMQVMVAAFVRSGFVERRPDADHQRILRNYLTDEGRAVLARSEEAADRIEGQMLAGLTGAQVKRLRETMEICVRNLMAGSAAGED
ncbi:MarR family winged helix-turn-helix transcriptional regulator [Arthrobacter sp. Marseille-P9274]|uniref:MarR family winged helix-turn-helix transcriptional regulator n=1 Tax=Arthrobacter sp. Marseille-P9274 TaxID=2866572 RepID=UPI0021C76F33|nr:MarR family transcriptional regulator [Arthrobacter sp. Marseille-P9274]